ncbi:MAG: flagellar basal body P-ring protein FlgI [Planctomycetota bacterium]
MTMSPSTPKSRLLPVPRLAFVAASMLALAVVLLSVAPGCGGQKEIVADTPAAAPGVTFTGPRELRGTIGSLARLEGTEPLLVERYGLVVNLDGTGSGVVPEWMRTWLVNEMRKLGVGRRSIIARNPEWQFMTPQRILDDPRTAVVRVSGLIPPGATQGTRFDLVVQALDEDTGTTSLAGGELWQAELGVGGGDDRLMDVRSLAVGRGPIYIPPYEAIHGSGGSDDDVTRYRREAVIVGGGQVTQPRRLEIVLNQPSQNFARRIEQRINSQYRRGTQDRDDTAVPASRAVIDLNIPSRYQSNPAHLIDLIGHTFVDPFEPIGTTVDRMVAWMERDNSPEVRRRASLTIKALGAIAAEHLARYYDHVDPEIRLAVLESGAYLKDTSVAEPLIALAAAPESETRIAVADGLVHIPRNTRVIATLRTLLSDPDIEVRMAAYRTLAVHRDPLVDSLAIEDLNGTKFVIDRVPSDVPSVYIEAQGLPRVVLFDASQGFRQPVFATLWGNRMTLMSPSSIAQASLGLEEGNTAFLPVTRRGDIVDMGDGVTQAEVFDAAGEPAVVRASNSDAAAILRDGLPETEGPTAFMLQGRVAENVAGRLTIELMGLDRSLEAMPLSVYYRDPREPRPTVHRVTPTVATLAFFLAHRPTMQQPQEGLNLDFGQVVDVLYRLGETGNIPAQVTLEQSPLADMIAGVRQRNAPIERRETDGQAPGIPEPESDAEPQEVEGGVETTARLD